jgi:hypothetical protein
MNIAKSWIPIKAGVNRLTVVPTSKGGKLRRERIRNQTIKICKVNMKENNFINDKVGWIYFRND